MYHVSKTPKVVSLNLVEARTVSEAAIAKVVERDASLLFQWLGSLLCYCGQGYSLFRARESLCKQPYYCYIPSKIMGNSNDDLHPLDHYTSSPPNHTTYPNVPINGKLTTSNPYNGYICEQGTLPLLCGLYYDLFTMALQLFSLKNSFPFYIEIFKLKGNFF